MISAAGHLEEGGAVEGLGILRLPCRQSDEAQGQRHADGVERSLKPHREVTPDFKVKLC